MNPRKDSVQQPQCVGLFVRTALVLTGLVVAALGITSSANGTPPPPTPQVEITAKQHGSWPCINTRNGKYPRAYIQVTIKNVSGSTITGVEALLGLDVEREAVRVLAEIDGWAPLLAVERAGR